MKFNVPKRAKTVTKELYEDVFLEIASIHNHKYRNKDLALKKPHRRKIEGLSIDAKLLDRITAEAMAGALLVGWKGVKDEDGNEVPFSEQAAKEFILQDYDAKEFILEVAGSSEDFILQEEFEQEEIKN